MASPRCLRRHSRDTSAHARAEGAAGEDAHPAGVPWLRWQGYCMMLSCERDVSWSNNIATLTAWRPTHTHIRGDNNRLAWWQGAGMIHSWVGSLIIAALIRADAARREGANTHGACPEKIKQHNFTNIVHHDLVHASPTSRNPRASLPIAALCDPSLQDHSSRRLPPQRALEPLILARRASYSV